MKVLVLPLMVILMLVCYACNSSSTSTDSPRKIIRHENAEGAEFLYTGWYNLEVDSNAFGRVVVGSGNLYYLNPRAIVTVEYLKSVELFTNNWGDKGLEIVFYGEGATNWARGTAGAINKQLGFVLDNELIYLANVNSKITNGMSAIIYAKGTEPDLIKLKRQIEASAGMVK